MFLILFKAFYSSKYLSLRELWFNLNLARGLCFLETGGEAMGCHSEPLLAPSCQVHKAPKSPPYFVQFLPFPSGLRPLLKPISISQTLWVPLPAGKNKSLYRPG